MFSHRILKTHRYWRSANEKHLFCYLNRYLLRIYFYALKISLSDGSVLTPITAKIRILNVFDIFCSIFNMKIDSFFLESPFKKQWLLPTHDQAYFKRIYSSSWTDGKNKLVMIYQTWKADEHHLKYCKFFKVAHLRKIGI